ncbi:D-2-hydroxyacid dehydrogenase [Sporolactobacillus vineae]|uniref:D-2-hydroxyacid dehydrogenase n=1 Tax=Sporolactobacillus vineae TaxID=444463 RepID=UPI00028920A8|nr:D-2-hydroxyacid dehydrogenase [Sporolactobacillus vineae]
MKILFFSVTEDEKEPVAHWSAEHHIDVDTTRDPLSLATVDRVKRYDGICIQQPVSVGAPEVYRKLKAGGIRQISTRSAGYDAIDLEEAGKNGIVVTNVPAYSPYSVAELAVTQALQLERHIPQFSRRIHHQDFRWDGLISREMRSLTVGIIGTGHIGATAARLFHGLGARVIAFDKYPNEQLRTVVAYQPSFQDVLRGADIVSLHTPLLDTTRHMINKETLALMKPGSFLINIARGGLINTADLIDALEHHQIAGAALDTFEDETMINQDLSGQPLRDPLLGRLIAMDQVILTPHIGFFTTTSVKNMVEGGLNGVVDILTTGTSANLVHI